MEIPVSILILKSGLYELNIKSWYIPYYLDLHPYPVFSPNEIQGIIEKHGLGGACSHSKPNGLSLFPHQREICAEHYTFTWMTLHAVMLYYVQDVSESQSKASTSSKVDSGSLAVPGM